ncbi:MAG: ankyrin repeat domain-containing protein [Alphaproteobacteria bacterium]
MAYDSFNRAAVTPQEAYRLADDLFECIQDHAGVHRAASLVKAGADLEARFGGTRDTALQRAILCRQDDIALYLIDNGSDLYSPALGGSCNIIIYSAMFGDYDDVMKKLLAKGVPPDSVPTPNCKTALMWAAEGGKWSRAKILIEKGADVHLRDDKGMTALDYAQEKQGAGFAQRLAALYDAVHANDRMTVMKPLTLKKPTPTPAPAPDPVMIVKMPVKPTKKQRKPKI